MERKFNTFYIKVIVAFSIKIIYTSIMKKKQIDRTPLHILSLLIVSALHLIFSLTLYLFPTRHLIKILWKRRNIVGIVYCMYWQFTKKTTQCFLEHFSKGLRGLQSTVPKDSEIWHIKVSSIKKTDQKSFLIPEYKKRVSLASLSVQI